MVSHKLKNIPAVGYIRVSTEEQANSGLSLSQQKSRIVAYAKATGLQLLEVIEDTGKSAKNLNRPGIQKALEMLREKQVQALVVLSLDRLTRSVKDLGFLVEFFEKSQAALVAVQDSINTLNAAGRLVLNVLGSIAQWEREAIAERTAAALAVKTQRHEKTGGTVPFGFDVTETGKLVTNQPEQDALRLILRLHKRGIPLRKIGDQLTSQGHFRKRVVIGTPRSLNKLFQGSKKG